MFFQTRQDIVEHVGNIANNRHVDGDVLINRRRIDIDVNFCRIRREVRQATRHAVVETRPDYQHHVTAMHGQVGLVSAVHA